MLLEREIAGGGDPDELLGEDLARGVGVDYGLDSEAGAGVAGVGEGVKDDVKSLGRFLDRGLGEAGDVEEAAGDGGVASGV